MVGVRRKIQIINSNNEIEKGRLLMEKEYRFRSLTSNKNVEIQPVTLQALEYVISDDSEPTNVAITGNYGAGKSSVVESFEKHLQNSSSPKIGIIKRLSEFLKKTKNKKFIHISLAQYDETRNNEEKGLNNCQINTIEGKIINQLLHQIEPNSIRKSIFKTLDAESRIRPWKNTAYLFSFLLLFLYFFSFNTWVNLIEGFSWLSWTTNVTTKLVALAILFFLLLYGIFYLLKLQRDIGFIKHLSLKSDKVETDIEVFSNDSNKVSYFDRYLDDVIYLFNQSKADVVVFEDIERFNNSRIFEKIKELNIVINRKREVCGESKLVFFYLVKDDLFESQERTKFFDFIIPVVPVVTASNSYDQLSKILKDMELHKGLDEKFLFNISLYLDDMRLINNICNEYLTYKESLGALELNSEKAFSMIVYKNIFPKDFSLLQKNQGYLYELLHSKDRQLENRKKELAKKTQSLREDIANAQAEHLQDEVELYGLIFQIPARKTVVKVNGKSQADFSSYHEFIKELLGNDSKITSFADFEDAYRNQFGSEENLDSVFPDKDSAEFQERLKNTKNKRKLIHLNEKLQSLQIELGELDKFRLSDVYESSIQIENFDSLYSESIKENPQFAIIPFFIRNTYIDETYQDYLTYFYGNTITKEEKGFIRNVISGRGGNQDISLTHFNEIVNRLELKDYKYSYILNYSLFEYLLILENENYSNERLDLIFDQNEILDFLIKFYDQMEQSAKHGFIDTEKKEKIHRALLEKWLHSNIDSFNTYLIDVDKYAAPQKNGLVIALLNLLDVEILSEESKVLLVKYIDDNFDILTGSYGYRLPQLTENLINLNMKFTNFSTFGTREERIKEENLIKLIDYIYNQKLYSLTETNIRFFVNWYSEKHILEDEFIYRNFELLNSQEVFKPLLDYCLSSENNLLQYVKLYIKLSNGKMDDYSSYVEQLFNHDILFQAEDVENEKEIPVESIVNSIPESSIDYTGKKFAELPNENRIELIRKLVATKKAQVNSDIVVSYFDVTQNIDEHLVDFINQNPSLTLSQDMFLQLDDEIQRDFFTQVVSADNLALTIYKSILASMQWHYEDFDVTGLSDDRLEVLIDLNVIKFNANNLKFIREKYPSMKNYSISRNIEKYLEIEEDVHDETELNDLLQCEQIDDSYKLQIIDILDHVSLKNKQFSLKLVAHILDSKFDIDDLSYIISSNYYDNADESIKIKIRQLAKENWDDLIRLDSEEISIQLCRELLAMDDIDPLDRASLLKDNLLYNPEMSTHRLALLGEYLDLFELWEIMVFLGDSDVYNEWEKAFEKLNRNEKGNNDVTVKKNNFNEKMRSYLLSKGLISSSSIQPLGIRLNGFRDGEIKYW